MNLADIRKKAEKSRQSATVSAEAPEKSAIQSDMAASVALVFEESALDDFEPPKAEIPEETCSYYEEARESNLPLPEAADLNAEPLSVQLPESAADMDADREAGQSLPLAAHSPAKSPVGYNALETILAGREMSAAAEDNSNLQALAYTSDEVEEYLCFRVAHEGYAISIMAIKEIVKPRDITEVPRMPAFILGVISLRGVIIPVMDMRLRLSLPVSPVAGRERIVVLRMETGFCGVLVDEVIQVARIKKSCIEDPPAVLDGIDRDFVTGLGHFDNRMLIILNLGTILDIGVH